MQSVGFTAGSNRVRGSRIIFMTDAALVRLVQKDPLLVGVSVLIIDEAHERSLNTDLVLGIAKQLASNPARTDSFHVVVASATIDPKPFVEYFTGDHSQKALDRYVLHVEGRTFPVDVEYKPYKDGGLRLRISDHVIPVLRETMEVIERRIAACFCIVQCGSPCTSSPCRHHLLTVCFASSCAVTF